MHPNFHNKTIYNSQSMEATQMSINKWTDKGDVVYTYDGILLSHKREGNNAICSNMDEPREDHAKWGKSDKYMIWLIWGILKNYPSELIYKTNIDSET